MLKLDKTKNLFPVNAVATITEINFQYEVLTFFYGNVSIYTNK